MLYIGAFKSYNSGTGYKSTCTTTGTSTPVLATATQTIATFRAQHLAFSNVFNTQNWFMKEAISFTALIERGTFLTENGGTSQNNKWEGYSWKTGATSDDQNLGQTLPLMNSTGVIKNSSNQTISNSYRGIEGYHSHLWEFVDGINIISGAIWLAKHGSTYLSDTTSAPYFNSGRTTLTAGSVLYITAMNSGTFIPSAANGGNNITKYCDGAWFGAGNMVLVFGGSLHYPD